jgi:hypothetical protein
MWTTGLVGLTEVAPMTSTMIQAVIQPGKQAHVERVIYQQDMRPTQETLNVSAG